MKYIDCHDAQTYNALNEAIKQVLAPTWKDGITMRYAPELADDATEFKMPVLENYEAIIRQVLKSFPNLKIEIIEIQTAEQ
jgi:hypothetical protein